MMVARTCLVVLAVVMCLLAAALAQGEGETSCSDIVGCAQCVGAGCSFMPATQTCSAECEMADPTATCVFLIPGAPVSPDQMCSVVSGVPDSLTPSAPADSLFGGWNDSICTAYPAACKATDAKGEICLKRIIEVSALLRGAEIDNYWEWESECPGTFCNNYNRSECVELLLATNMTFNRYEDGKQTSTELYSPSDKAALKALMLGCSEISTNKTSPICTAYPTACELHDPCGGVCLVQFMSVIQSLGDASGPPSCNFWQFGMSTTCLELLGGSKLDFTSVSNEPLFDVDTSAGYLKCLCSDVSPHLCTGGTIGVPLDDHWTTAAPTTTATTAATTAATDTTTLVNSTTTTTTDTTKASDDGSPNPGKKDVVNSGGRSSFAVISASFAVLLRLTLSVPE
ncbi:hypothetical protein NFJ02_38g96980 [Pycnococcus provasolii]